MISSPSQVAPAAHVGETIFFSVDIETPIVGVEFSVTGKKIRN